jgi:hypothetical protein
MTAFMRADARITRREAILELGSILRFPLEVDDDGAEYLRPTSDTTLDVHVDEVDPHYPLVLTIWHWKSQADARTAVSELQPLIARSTGWTVIAQDW